MLLNYYKLSEDPFGVTPDPRFLYLGPKHREALASLVYGTESRRGFLALIAQPGMGKTSLLYQYMEGLRGKARTVFVFRTDCNSQEFIHQVLVDAGVEDPGHDLASMYEMLDRILTNEMRAGQRFVLVIDEAQNLEDKVLESIRMLSNFETPWMKLMQIVIAGQPQLAEKLMRPSMTQFRQRISSVIRLEPFTQAEVDAYIDHRLWTAGWHDPNLFSAPARRLIAEHSEGIPRQINNLCFNAMSLACAMKQRTIDREVVLEVLRDLDLAPIAEQTPKDAQSEDKRPPVDSAAGKSSLLKRWGRRAAAAALLSFLTSATTINTPSAKDSLLAAPVSSAPAVSVRAYRSNGLNLKLEMQRGRSVSVAGPRAELSARASIPSQRRNDHE